MGHPERFHEVVPKSYEANLRFRIKIIRMGYDDPVVAKQLWRMCKLNPKFYFNCFLILVETRAGEGSMGGREMPWITFPKQDELIDSIQRCVMTGRNLAVDKSRDMGASFTVAAMARHNCTFLDNCNIGVLSKRADLVYNKNNSSAIFSKIDIVSKYVPRYLRDPYEVQIEMKIFSPLSQSSINGMTTVANATRSMRCTWVFWDEVADTPNAEEIWASSASVTKTRVLVSTHQGIATKFYTICQSPDIADKIEMDWWDNPMHCEGLHRDETTGQWTSVWFENECAILGTEQRIAQELLRDPQRSDAQFFETEVIKHHIAVVCQPPALTGTIMTGEMIPASRRFEVDPNGHAWLWFRPLRGAPSPDEEFCMGGDVSWGAGATPSCLAVYSKRSGELMLEYANSKLQVPEFARVALAIGYWFNTAEFIYERNGPGVMMAPFVRNYPNLYWKRSEAAIDAAPGDVPGWQNDKESKKTLFTDYQFAMKSGRVKNRSERAIKELPSFVLRLDGKVEHAASAIVENVFDARENHGDLTVAHALAVKGVLASLPPPADIKTEKEQAEDEWEQFRRDKVESIAEDRDDFANGREFYDDFSQGSEDD